MVSAHSFFKMKLIQLLVEHRLPTLINDLLNNLLNDLLNDNHSSVFLCHFTDKCYGVQCGILQCAGEVIIPDPSSEHCCPYCAGKHARDQSTPHRIFKLKYLNY